MPGTTLRCSLGCVPTSMVFVPSVNGLSHNIAEFTEAIDLQAGADVLLQVVLDLAGVAGE